MHTDKLNFTDLIYIHLDPNSPRRLGNCSCIHAIGKTPTIGERQQTLTRGNEITLIDSFIKRSVESV